ncbi:MAG TPA: hypothetical protein VFQ24_07365 [Terriglobia bacterium]|nr:hypothetical protein [Terriglobia bacterium]
MMKMVTFPRCVCFALLLASFCGWAVADDHPAVTFTKIKVNVPAENAYIIRFHVDQPSPASSYETGNLHILYSDKTEIIQTLLPKEKSTEKNVIYNQEGIDEVKLAPDKRTIGWEETFDNCCTSYSVPLVLAVYRSGGAILRIQPGQMLWYWTFRDGGKRVAAVWGATHGPEVGDYQLYDVETGHLVSEVFGDPATQSLSADAPEWAKEVDRQR